MAKGMFTGTGRIVVISLVTVILYNHIKGMLPDSAKTIFK